MRAFTSHLVAAVCGAALVSADWASDVALIKHTGESVGETRTYQGRKEHSYRRPMSHEAICSAASVTMKPF